MGSLKNQMMKAEPEISLFFIPRIPTYITKNATWTQLPLEPLHYFFTYAVVLPKTCTHTSMCELMDFPLHPSKEQVKSSFVYISQMNSQFF